MMCLRFLSVRQQEGLQDSFRLIQTYSDCQDTKDHVARFELRLAHFGHEILAKRFLKFCEADLNHAWEHPLSM